jgi:hypothetical protein
MFGIGDVLKDAGAVTSSGYGTVDAAAKVVDLKEGLVRGNIIIDVSAIDISSGNELCEIHLMGGSDESFTQEVSLCSKELGHNASLEGNRDSKPGRYILPFQNEMAGRIWPYVRIRHVLSGTTPSINYQARLEKDLAVTGYISETVTTTTTTTTT